MSYTAHSISREGRLYVHASVGGQHSVQAGYLSSRLDEKDTEWLFHLITLCGDVYLTPWTTVVLHGDGAMQRRLEELPSWKAIEVEQAPAIRFGLSCICGQFLTREMDYELLAELWRDRAEDLLMIYPGTVDPSSPSLCYDLVFKAEYFPTSSKVSIDRMTDGELITLCADPSCLPLAGLFGGKVTLPSGALVAYSWG